MFTQAKRVTTLRWIARVTGLALFVLWGAFFVEHLNEFTISQHFPPPSVWLIQSIHLAFLLGYLIALKWEITGSVLIIIGSAIFFAAAAGSNFLPFFIITIMLALIYLFCSWQSKSPLSTMLLR